LIEDNDVSAELAALRAAARQTFQAATAMAGKFMDTLELIHARTDQALRQIEQIEAALEGEEPLPEPSQIKITIAAANASIQAGQIARFEVELSEPGQATVRWHVLGDGLGRSGMLEWLPDSALTKTIEIPTDPDSAGGTLVVELLEPKGAVLSSWRASVQVLPGPPPEPDLTRGLIFEIKAPIDAPQALQPFSEEVVTISMVFAPQPSALHQKLFCVENALNLGLHPSSGPPDIWCYCGQPRVFYALKTPPTMQYYKPSHWLVEFPEGAIRAKIDDASASQVVPFGRESAVGKRASLMQGFWKGVAGKDRAQGRMLHCRIWNRTLSPSEKVLEHEAISGMLENSPSPPQEQATDLISP
jgi:hypothetical protein